VSQTVLPGTPQVQLSVTAKNADTYQWYKDGLPLTDDPTDALYVGEDTATLTIYDVQVEDEGTYHCEADNSLQMPAASTAALLMTQRLVGWWKLDGDLTDSVQQEISGAPAHNGVCDDPNYVAIGKDASALEFFGDVAGLVKIADSNDFFNFYPQGYTVSAWVNMPEKTGSWGAYVAKQGGDPQRGFILTHNGSGQPVHTLRQSFNDLGSNVDADDNDWHLVIGTYDGAAKEGKVYVDGVLAGQAVNSGLPQASSAALIFGAEWPDGGTPFIGSLDDVRIWSYPLDDISIAELYVFFNPGAEVCTAYPEFDIAGQDGIGDEYRDCLVNLYDLMPIIQKWLDCNLVPTCLP
jgi:hypothetical protein